MSFLEQTAPVGALALLVYLVHISRTNRFFQSYVHQDKIKVLISLLLSVVLVSCKPGSSITCILPRVNYPQSCKEFCNTDKEHVAFVIIRRDKRCLDLKSNALEEGRQKKYCNTDFMYESKPKHPDPILCRALMTKAQKECEQLPPDRSMRDEQIIDTTTYNRDGKPVRVNGEPVIIKDEICICDEEQTTGKESTGKTTK